MDGKRQRHQRMRAYKVLHAALNHERFLYVSASTDQLVAIYFLIRFEPELYQNRFILFFNLLWMFLFMLHFFFKYSNVSHMTNLQSLHLLIATIFFLLYTSFSGFTWRILSLLTFLCKNVASSNPVQGRVQQANTHLHKRLWLMWRMVFEGLCGRIGKWHSKGSS